VKDIRIGDGRVVKALDTVSIVRLPYIAPKDEEQSGQFEHWKFDEQGHGRRQAGVDPLYAFRASKEQDQ
jgi:hypothetical protein